MNTSVTEYINQSPSWQKELNLLREIVLDCNLIEEVKWDSPCYTYDKANVILLGRFKDHCVISFVKGALLNDDHKILSKPGENSQSVRFIRFKKLSEISKIKQEIKSYIFEAIELEKAGIKVQFKETTEKDFPIELQHKLDKNPKLKKAFLALPPGKQRGYIIYISTSKNPATRESRIDKYTERILAGKGFHDCVCGLSKRMPTCDGSHKNLK